MLTTVSGSVARSRYTQHDHTPSGFTNKRDIILTQGGLGDGAPPIGAEQGIYVKNVEYKLKNNEQ